MAILFSNATILPMTADEGAPKTFTGFVGVAGSRIALVTASASEADAFRAAHPDARIIDCTGRLVMPGLVNTHCHAAMTLQRSYADDIALMEWLHDYIWPFEARQTADDVALGMTLGIVEMLLGGVTSFVDMYYHENRCVEVPERLGIRAMLGCNYFDSNVEEVLPEVGQAVELAAGCDRIRIALAPHSPYTVSPENLRRGKETAERYGLHLMTHIAETQDEVRIVREKYGMTPVEHLDALGMPTPATRRAYCFNKFLFIIILPVLRKTQTRNTRPCNAFLPYKSARVLHLRDSCPCFKERRPRTSDSWQGLGQRPNVSSHCFSVDCTQFCAKDQAPAQFCVFHVLRLCYNGGSFRIFPGGFMIYGSF